MPKRTAQEKIEHYNRKIRKLEQKKKKTRRHRVLVLESSESDAVNNEDGDINGDSANSPPLTAATTSTVEPEATHLLPETAVPPPDTIPELDPDILSALGEADGDTPEFGENIHDNLAQRWLPILRRGISKETRDKIIKDYLVPSNCTLLQAPKFNAEISAAITDMARNRDKKMEVTQQLLGVGITAVTRAMTLLVTSDEARGTNIKAIKMLSDGCRILSDVHYSQTQARVKMVTPGLERSFLSIIKDTERDNTLFGVKLSEKIKASKAIEKQGLQIKKTFVSQKPFAQVQSARPRRQENWAGPSRFPSSRGGRGGQRRQAPATRKAQTTTTPRSSNPSKARPAAQE